MKKGLVIALIVGGVFLAACGALFTVSLVTRNVFHGGQNLLGTRDRVWNDPADRNYSVMPHGMRGGGRGYSSNEDFFVQRWAYMLGIPLDELQTRLDAGESLSDIAESQGLDMPCDELFNGSDTDLDTTDSTSWDLNGYETIGMCF